MSDVAAPQTGTSNYNWDFFIAHASDDLPAAQNLYLKLEPATVFLDDESVLPGDDWDETLRVAQRSSLISVILLSSKTEKAYYEREEIAAAIDMARQDPRTHRVVPVYLNGKTSLADVPYGLRLKHSLYVPESGDLTEAGQRLLITLNAMKHYEDKKTQIVADQRIALQKIVNGRSSLEVLAGFNEVTKFVRPILYTLIALLIVVIVVLAISILFPSDVPSLFAWSSAAVAALLLFSIMSLISRSLKYAPLIAEGRINGG